MREVRLAHPDLPPEQTIPGLVTDDGRVIPNLADAGWTVAADDDVSAHQTSGNRAGKNRAGRNLARNEKE